MGKKAIVIGAGIGGIATSILLSRKGYQVKIFEKNAFAGGRCGGILKNGHRFDVGATLLMMPKIFEQTFEAMGSSFEHEVQLIRMCPSYRINFADGTKIDLTSDLTNLKPQLESMEPGSYQKFLKYMNDSGRSFLLAWDNFIDKNYYRFTDMINLKNLSLLFEVNAHKKFYGSIGKYFKSDKLRSVFTLQCLYIGLNPLTAPGIFYSIPGMELTEGVWFPKGGMNQIAETLNKIASQNGVDIHLNCQVQKIATKDSKAIGVELDNGDVFEADIIVANSDLPYTYNHLLSNDKHAKKLNKMKYSCSAMVFHWGMDVLLPNLEQHNVFISANHEKYLKSVFNGSSMDENITFYLHSACQSSPDAAPKNEDSISVIVPIGNLLDKKECDWEGEKTKIRNSIIRRLHAEGFHDFENHIKFEMVYTPENWQSTLNLTNGSTFGSLDHNLFQMGYSL
jgi:phytoene desaturase